MKKIFRTALCAILALFLLLPNFAAAAQFTDEADSLASLGLFKGTNNGYELDRVPTRAEAAVMLVRFLGKEKEALGLTWRAPFTDVPDWAKSYVQYLYENKLTSGTSDTTYTPDGNCSAQMYATFLLRALGYSDAKGDFSYSDAINYAKLKKIINEKNYDENGFLRDHMVSMSYCALGLSTADGKYTSLIRRLAADGAVTNAQAEAFLAEYAQRYGDGVGYLKKYSDYDAAAEWIRTNIDGTDMPPVSFTLGGRSSSSMKWTKSAGKEQTVVDYAESERPAERRVREIVYECAAEKLRVRLTLTTYPDYPVVEYGAHIDNLASVPTGTVRDFMSVNGSIAKADGRTVLHYNQGSHGYAETEYQPFTRTLSQSAFRLAVSNGMPTCEFLPYFNAEDQNGGGVIAAVVWQGGWEASFSAADGNVRLSAGQNGAGFCMKGGESFKFPGIVLLFYKDGDWQEGQNVWRRWVVEHNLMRNTGRRDFTQNVFVCSGFPGADRDISSVNAFAKSGAAKLYNCVFELDAGWYDPGLSNWGYTGNWTRMASGYENGGLKKVSDACHKNGMSFCMWFEPERLYSGTDFAKTLGNSVIYLDGSGNYVPYGSTGGSEYQGLINYGDRKAEDAVVALLDRAINDYGIDVYRQDFNTSNAPYWSAYDRYESSALGYARSGATENHACEGYINAWTRLEELHPGLVFDACAGGGRRYDLETMRFAFVHTKSDYWAEPRSQQCQNLGMYSWNIFTGTGFTDAGSYDVRTRLTLSVGIGAGADAGTLGALKEWASMQKYMMCDYYALTGYSLSETANIAMQFNSPEQGGGMAVAYLRAGGAFTLKLRGLDAKAKYRVWDTDASGYIVATGETLMNGGCKLSRGKGSASAAVVYYEKTSESVQGGVNLSSGVDFESLSVQANDEAAIKALAANAGAEQIRSLFGSYLGGGDGMDHIALRGGAADSGAYSYGAAPTFYSPYTEKARDALARAEEFSQRGFSYDPAADELYSAYRKQYLREGKRAAEDAIGLASAKTGGVPSSYAVGAAAQANGRYAAALTDKLPELYSAAYDRYRAQAQALESLYKLYANAENADLSKYRDSLAQYNKDRAFDYGVYTDGVDEEYRRLEAQRELAADRRKEENDAYSRAETDRRYELDRQKAALTAEKQRNDASEAQRKREIELAKLAATYGDTALLEALGISPAADGEAQPDGGKEDPADYSVSPDYVYVSNYGYMKWSVLNDLLSKGKAAKIFNNENGSYSYYYLD